MRRNEQPRLRIRSSRTEILIEAAGIFGLLFIFGMVAAYWPVLPESIPGHFGMDGRPDAYGGKGILYLLPVVGLFFYIVFTALRRYPHVLDYVWKITEVNAYAQYRLMRWFISTLKAEIIWIFTYIELKLIQVPLGKAEGLGPIFLPIIVVVIFGTIAIYLYLAYRAR